jgi:hypothetical protein
MCVRPEVVGSAFKFKYHKYHNGFVACRGEREERTLSDKVFVLKQRPQTSELGVTKKSARALSPAVSSSRGWLKARVNTAQQTNHRHVLDLLHLHDLLVV